MRREDKKLIIRKYSVGAFMLLDKRSLLIIFGICLLICVAGNNIQVQASQKPEYFFFVHMVAPTSNPVRMQYAQIIERELPKIGIGTELSLISWAALGPRCTDQEVGMYSHGGYDICFLGSSYSIGAMRPVGVGSVLHWLFGSDSIPPSGFNVMYWSPEAGKNYNNYRAQESDDLLQNISTNLNLTEVKYDIREWQKLWYDVMPNVLIYNQYEVHAVSKELYGYDPMKNPLNSIEDVWVTSDYVGMSDQVVLAVSTGGDTFNPLIATDVYDHYVNNPAFDGLVGNTPSKEILLPSKVTNRDIWMIDHYNTTDYLELYPRIADGMGTFSADGLAYSIDVKEGVYWHDGEIVDAWDVAFSFQAPIIPAIGAPQYSNLLIPFGIDNKTAKHGNYSFTVTDEDSDGFYEHINFTFDQTFPPFEMDYLGTYLFPEHILGDPVGHGFTSNGDFDPVNTWLVPPGDWGDHSTTTGQTTDPGGYTGPIGCGSMIFESFDSLSNIITLKKFENIKWDNATGAWVTDNTVSHWNIANLGDMPDKVKIIAVNRDSAFEDMKTGNVNILDPQFALANIIDELQAEASIQTIFSPERGFQAIYFNPKFVEDGVYHLMKKGVRHAISHMVPREDIITYLLNGLGVPAYTPVPHTYWEAISEEEMLAYKKTVTGTNGLIPESGATTAYDEYLTNSAFDWLDSEGYNTTAWRDYWHEGNGTTPVTTPLDTTPSFILGLLFISIILIILSISLYLFGYSFLMRKK